MEILKIKLGSTERMSFYHDNNRGYTMIQKGKMPWFVLNYLYTNRYFGATEYILSEELHEALGIVLNNCGISNSLRMLLRDFEEAELIRFDYTHRTPKIYITKLGIMFLKNNIIESDCEGNAA